MKKHTDIVIDREGNAVVGAEVYVRAQSDNSLVQLYSDDGSTTTANPTTTNSDGMFSFWTANNTLKLQVWIDGVQENEVTNVQHFDIDGITAFGFSLIDDANAAAALTTLGVSAFAQTLLDDADAATARTTLGLAIGTNVQAYDPDLAAIAGLTPSRGDVLYYNGTQWTRLAAGTSGYFLKTQGAGADPAWGAITINDLSGGGAVPTIANTGLSTTVGAGAAATDSAAGIFISNSTANGAIIKKTAPATPYTITAYVVCAGQGTPSLGWSDGTKYQFVYINKPNGRIIVQSDSVFNAFATTNASLDYANFGSAIWLQISDDGTNVSFKVSVDGVNFITAYSVAKASGYLGASGYSEVFTGSTGANVVYDTLARWSVT